MKERKTTCEDVLRLSPPSLCIPNTSSLCILALSTDPTHATTVLFVSLMCVPVDGYYSYKWILFCVCVNVSVVVVCVRETEVSG